LQIIAASVDAPPIDVLLDGQPFVTHLDYGQGTGEKPITPTSHSLTVQVETPGASTTVIGPTTLDAAANMDYVVAIEGNLGGVQAPGLSLVIFSHELAVVPSQSARIQVLSVYGSIDVYLSAPGASFSSATKLGTAPGGGSFGPMEVSGEVWLSAGGDSRAIPLTGGTDLVISVLPPFLAPGDPYLPLPACCYFAVSAVDAFGQSSWLLGPGLLGDPAVRFINDSPGAPALAVTANGNLTDPVVSALAYEQSTTYVRGALPRPFNGPLYTGNFTQGPLPAPLAEVKPGIYRYEFFVTPTSNLSDVLASQAVDLEVGTFYSLYALGPLAQIVPFITRDDVRPYSTQARLRFIQGSPSAQLVDVYLTASGAGIATTAPTFSAMPFAADTGYVSYVQGSYDLTVTLAGSKTPIIGPTSVTLTNFGVYTAVARDAPGGGAPYGLINLDDTY
jgi:hypothetical protein